MNYFAHGMRFVDRPYFLAGTAVPDWLSAVDRRVRMRARHVLPFADETGSMGAELAAGVLQHLNDDRWFHRTPAFFEATGELTRLFRQMLGADDGFRPGFLGHIATELILDGVLIEQHPDRLDAYYEALAEIEPAEIQAAVNRMARKPTSQLCPLIPRFHKAEFLRDYLEPAGLLFRLNQVMRRIKLKQLPGEAEAVIEAGWGLVKFHVDRLLPESHFVSPTIC